MQLAPYTPSLYLPGSTGRYRSYGYPRVTRTPIPGAGYPNRRLMWGDQMLNLDGSAVPQRYGRGPVPLRGCDGLVGCDGLGALVPTYTRMDGHAKLPSASTMRARYYLEQGLGIDVSSTIDTATQLLRDPNSYLRAHGPALVTSLDTYVVGPLIGAVARKSLPYALKYIAPPIAVLYLLSGLALYYSHAAYARGSSRVTANKRRRRRRR